MGPLLLASSPAGPAISPSFRKAGPISWYEPRCGIVANRFGGSVLNVISIPLVWILAASLERRSTILVWGRRVSSNSWRNCEL